MELGKNKRQVTSQYRGVHWHESAKKWCAQSKRDGKINYLGLYDNEEEAARASDWFGFHCGDDKYNLGEPTQPPVGYEFVIPAKGPKTRAKRGGQSYSSRYRGVSWNAQKQIWKAALQVQKEKIYLGRFEYEEDAAVAYNKKVLELKGPTAPMNDIIPTLTKTRYPGQAFTLSEDEMLLMSGFGDDILEELVATSSTEEESCPSSPSE